MHARTKRCYNERGSRTNYVRSSILHCCIYIHLQDNTSAIVTSLWEPPNSLPVNTLCKSVQERTNPRRRATVTTKHYTVAPNIWRSSVWNLRQVTLLMHRIYRCFPDFWQICTPVSISVILFNNSCRQTSCYTITILFLLRLFTRAKVFRIPRYYTYFRLQDVCYENFITHWQFGCDRL